MALCRSGGTLRELIAVAIRKHVLTDVVPLPYPVLPIASGLRVHHGRYGACLGSMRCQRAIVGR